MKKLGLLEADTNTFSVNSLKLCCSRTNKARLSSVWSTVVSRLETHVFVGASPPLVLAPLVGAGLPDLFGWAGLHKSYGKEEALLFLRRQRV